MTGRAGDPTSIRAKSIKGEVFRVLGLRCRLRRGAAQHDGRGHARAPYRARGAAALDEREKDVGSAPRAVGEGGPIDDVVRVVEQPDARPRECSQDGNA